MRITKEFRDTIKAKLINRFLLTKLLPEREKLNKIVVDDIISKVDGFGFELAEEHFKDYITMSDKVVINQEYNYLLGKVRNELNELKCKPIYCDIISSKLYNLFSRRVILPKPLPVKAGHDIHIFSNEKAIKDNADWCKGLEGLAEQYQDFLSNIYIIDNTMVDCKTTQKLISVMPELEAYLPVPVEKEKKATQYEAINAIVKDITKEVE